MPKIRTKKGTFLYDSIFLYPGVKRINKDIAADNLAVLKSILDTKNIPFQLAFGTLLGVIREGDFIDWDEDIDLAILDEYRDSFFDVISDLESVGFKICRYDRRDLVSLMRNEEYIDLYFFRKWRAGYRVCSGWINLERHLLNSTTISFKGNTYCIPRDWNEYLISEYGNNWKFPIEWNNYNLPFWRKAIFQIKEFIKIYLPEFLFCAIVKTKESKQMQECIKRLKQNLNNDIPDSL